MQVEKAIDKFWANGRDLKEEYKYKAAVEQLLLDLRPLLDDSSPTAQAIAKEESWESIAQKAKEEGLNEIYMILTGESA